MGRVIEKNNLAFNHMTNICDLCKRCKGFKDNDTSDIYECRYNFDNKGLKSGLVINQMENYKCKYFKRNSKYQTCKLQSKICKRKRNGICENIKYSKGKFIINKIKSIF